MKKRAKKKILFNLFWDKLIEIKNIYSRIKSEYFLLLHLIFQKDQGIEKGRKSYLSFHIILMVKKYIICNDLDLWLIKRIQDIMIKKENFNYRFQWKLIFRYAFKYFTHYFCKNFNHIAKKNRELSHFPSWTIFERNHFHINLLFCSKEKIFLDSSLTEHLDYFDDQSY